MAKTKQELNTLIDEKIYENTSGAITASALNAVLKEVVGAQDALKFEPRQVSALPAVTDAEERVLYLVPKAEGADNNAMDEYIFVNGQFEKIGDTAVQATEYTAGENIMLSGNKISLAPTLTGMQLQIGNSGTNGVIISGRYVTISGSGLSISGSVIDILGQNKENIRLSNSNIQIILSGSGVGQITCMSDIFMLSANRNAYISGSKVIIDGNELSISGSGLSISGSGVTLNPNGDVVLSGSRMKITSISNQIYLSGIPQVNQVSGHILLREGSQCCMISLADLKTLINS